MKPRDPAAWIGWPLTLFVLLAILRLTLSPAGQDQVIPEDFLCLLCGEAGLANLLRNVLLFVPLGIGLGLLIRSPVRAWLPTLLLTLTIEVTQIFIPGRNPLLVDVLANAGGGALGVAFVAALRASIRPEGSGWGHRLWLLLPFPALVATAWAFQLAPPDPPHYLQIQPRLAHLAIYPAQVFRAEVGGERVQVGRVGDPDALEDRLFRGDTVEVEVGIQPRSWGVASLVSVYTGERKEAFLLGVAADDVVLRLPFRAARLRLSAPDLRLTGALGGLEEGSRALIRYWAPAGGLAKSGACLSLEGVGPGQAPRTHEACGLRPTLGHGWSLLYFIAGFTPGALEGTHRVWLLLLTVPVGLLARRLRSVGLLGGAAGLTAWAAPAVLGSVAVTPPGQVALVVGGVVGGHLARRLWLAAFPASGPMADRGAPDATRCESPTPAVR